MLAKVVGFNKAKWLLKIQMVLKHKLYQPIQESRIVYKPAS